MLTGANYSTECVREPLEWHYHASDLRQLKDIHGRFGTRPLKTFPTADIFKFKLYYRFVKGMHVVKPLNYTPYIKEEAMEELADKLRLAEVRAQALRVTLHAFLRRLLAANEIRIRQASRAFLQPHPDEAAHARGRAWSASPSRPTTTETIAQDFEYIATKLGLSVPELQAIMNGPNRTYRDYKSRMPYDRARHPGAAPVWVYRRAIIR